MVIKRLLFQWLLLLAYWSCFAYFDAAVIVVTKDTVALEVLMWSLNNLPLPHSIRLSRLIIHHHHLLLQETADSHIMSLHLLLLDG
jgi:hypothetical protein